MPHSRVRGTWASAILCNPFGSKVTRTLYPLCYSAQSELRERSPKMKGTFLHQGNVALTAYMQNWRIELPRVLEGISFQTGLSQDQRGRLASQDIGKVRWESRVCCSFEKRVPIPTASVLGLGNQLNLSTWERSGKATSLWSVSGNTSLTPHPDQAKDLMDKISSCPQGVPVW